MILPDLNLLVYAYNSKAPDHKGARRWWETVLSNPRSVALPWVVSLGFLRLMTSRSVLVDPMTPEVTIGHLRAWLDRPQVGVLEPGPRHLDIVKELIDSVGRAGRLTTDIHLAALAIEDGAEIHTNDTDFDELPGLRRVNPLT